MEAGGATVDKELGKLFKELEAQGFRIEAKTRGYMVFPADRSLAAVTIHKTPSDHRAWKNMISQLRRSGYDAKRK